MDAVLCGFRKFFRKLLLGRDAHLSEAFKPAHDVARAGGEAAGEARKAVEARTGVPVITEKNAVQLHQVIVDLIEGDIEE